MLRYNDRIFNIYYLTIENPKPPNAKRHRIGKFGANILFFFIFFLPYPQLLIFIVISINMVPISFLGPHWAKFLKNIFKIFKCSKFRKYKIYFDRLSKNIYRQHEHSTTKNNIFINNSYSDPLYYILLFILVLFTILLVII